MKYTHKRYYNFRYSLYPLFSKGTYSFRKENELFMKKVLKYGSRMLSFLHENWLDNRNCTIRTFK